MLFMGILESLNMACPNGIYQETLHSSRTHWESGLALPPRSWD